MYKQRNCPFSSSEAQSNEIHTGYEQRNHFITSKVSTSKTDEQTRRTIGARDFHGKHATEPKLWSQSRNASDWNYVLTGSFGRLNDSNRNSRGLLRQRRWPTTSTALDDHVPFVTSFACDGLTGWAPLLTFDWQTLVDGVCL